MRWWIFQSALMLLTACLLVADEAKTPQERVEQRRATIEKIKEHDRAEAYAKLALELTNLASEQSHNGNDAAAKQTAPLVAEAAAKSLDAARLKHKKVKQAEILLRETARRLDEVRRSISILDQAPFKQAHDQVEKTRKAMLELLFKK